MGRFEDHGNPGSGRREIDEKPQGHHSGYGDYGQEDYPSRRGKRDGARVKDVRNQLRTPRRKSQSSSSTTRPR